MINMIKQCLKAEGQTFSSKMNPDPGDVMESLVPLLGNAVPRVSTWPRR